MRSARLLLVAGAAGLLGSPGGGPPEKGACDRPDSTSERPYRASIDPKWLPYFHGDSALRLFVAGAYADNSTLVARLLRVDGFGVPFSFEVYESNKGMTLISQRYNGFGTSEQPSLYVSYKKLGKAHISLIRRLIAGSDFCSASGFVPDEAEDAGFHVVEARCGTQLNQRTGDVVFKGAAGIWLYFAWLSDLDPVTQGDQDFESDFRRWWQWHWNTREHEEFSNQWCPAGARIVREAGG
jgi:hypothetical protein